MRELTESALNAEGEELGRSLPSGAVLSFEGELGAGKTTFIRAIARGLGVTLPATSPTYALVHRYQGRRGPVFHLDCYRLRNVRGSARSRLAGSRRRGRRDAGGVAGAGRRVGCRLRRSIPAASSRRRRRAAAWSVSDVAGDRHRDRSRLGRAGPARDRCSPRRRSSARGATPRSCFPRSSTSWVVRAPAFRSVEAHRARRWSRQLHRTPGRRRRRQGAGAKASRSLCGPLRRCWPAAAALGHDGRLVLAVSDALRGEVFAAAYRFTPGRVDTVLSTIGAPARRLACFGAGAARWSPVRQPTRLGGTPAWPSAGTLLAPGWASGRSPPNRRPSPVGAGLRPSRGGAGAMGTHPWTPVTESGRHSPADADALSASSVAASAIRGAPRRFREVLSTPSALGWWLRRGTEAAGLSARPGSWPARRKC